MWNPRAMRLLGTRWSRAALILSPRQFFRGKHIAFPVRKSLPRRRVNDRVNNDELSTSLEVPKVANLLCARSESVKYARRQVEYYEKNGELMNSKLFEDIVQTLYRYGYEDEAENCYSLYKSRNVEFISTSFSINMLMIDVYLTGKKYDEAIAIVRGLHTLTNYERTQAYKELITGLARCGRIDEAMVLLKEMYNLYVGYLMSNYQSLKTNEMYVAILAACIPGNQEYAESWLIEQRPSLSREEFRSIHAKGMDLFRFLKATHYVTHSELMPMVREWFYSDPVNKWVIKDANFDENGVCSACQNTLEPRQKVDAETEKQVKEYLLRAEWNVPMSNLGRFKHQLAHFDAYLDKTGPFDVIIDGMNVGLDSSYHLKLFTSVSFDYEQVLKAVEHFTSQGKKVLLVMKLSDNRQLNCRDKKSNWVHSLPENCHLFNASVFYDDIFLLHALARCGESCILISKDSFEDMSASMPDHLRLKFLAWVRSHTVLYCFVGDQDNVSFGTLGESYNLCWQMTDTHIHLPCTYLVNKCIQKVT